jgi:hypothetical protein
MTKQHRKLTDSGPGFSACWSGILAWTARLAAIPSGSLQPPDLFVPCPAPNPGKFKFNAVCDF